MGKRYCHVIIRVGYRRIVRTLSRQPARLRYDKLIKIRANALINGRNVRQGKFALFLNI